METRQKYPEVVAFLANPTTDHHERVAAQRLAELAEANGVERLSVKRAGTVPVFSLDGRLVVVMRRPPLAEGSGAREQMIGFDPDTEGLIRYLSNKLYPYPIVALQLIGQAGTTMDPIVPTRPGANNVTMKYVRMGYLADLRRPADPDNQHMYLIFEEDRCPWFHPEIVRKLIAGVPV